MTKTLTDSASTDSARLIWVDAFVALESEGNYGKAGDLLDSDGTTIQRRIQKLQAWLRRILVLSDSPPSLTQDGLKFFPTAVKVMDLVSVSGLRAELSITRVHADGTVSVDGVKIRTPQASEIGSAMIAYRAPLNAPTIARPAISGREIDMEDIVRSRDW